MRLNTIAGNVIWSTVAHILGRGSLVVAAILLARTLDTNSFAAYSYFQLTVSMLAAYAAMGLGVTASRFFAESGHVEDAKMPPIGTLWILSIIVGFAFALAVLLLPANWMDGGLGVPRWILALGVFAMGLDVVPSGGIVGLERYSAATLTAGASAMVLIFGAIFAGFSGSAVAAMAAFVVSSLIQSTGNTIVVLREVGWHKLVRHARMGRPELRNVLSFAGPMLGVSLLAASGSWVVGRIILTGPAGEHGFALYAIGLQWYALALFIPGTVSRVLLPRLVRSRLQLHQNGSRELVRRGAVVTLVAASVVSVGGFTLSPWLIKFYGSSYEVDKWLLGAFLVAAIPSAPVNTVGNAIVIAEGQRVWFLMILLWFSLIVVTAMAVDEQGAWGGALALGFSSLALAVLTVSIGRKRGVV